MNLTQRKQRPGLQGGSPLTCCAEFTQKRGAVTLDGGFGIFLGEAKIERAASICPRESPPACGKSMDEPGELAQVLGAENIEFALPGNL
jgi:hypothetical protein